MHARTHAYAHTSCRVEISIGAKTSTILVRKNWENYNQMLRSTVQKIKIQNFTTHCFGSKSLAARTNHPNPPVLAHTYTKFKINPRLNWLTDLVRIFPGFFSRGGLPKLTRCKIPFGKIRHMICGGNEKRRLLYNCRYQCIILQNISLFLFPFFVLVSCSQRSPVVPLCTDILSSEFCQSNYSTTRPSPRGWR